MPPAGTSGSRMDVCRLVEVVGWLRWKPGHPPTIGPGKSRADQAPRVKVVRPVGRSTLTRGARPAPRRVGRR
jgi:hypothetical protein